MGKWNFICKECGHAWDVDTADYNRSKNQLFHASLARTDSHLLGKKGRDAAVQAAILTSTTVNFDKCPECGSKKTKKNAVWPF